MKRYLLLAVVVVGCGSSVPAVPARLRTGLVCVYNQTPPTTPFPADGCGGKWIYTTVP